MTIHPELPNDIEAERAVLERRRLMWRERAKRKAARTRGENIPLQKPGPKPGYKPSTDILEKRSAAIREQWTTRKQDIADRFWSKVDKSGECWTWTATKLPKGYGRFQIGGKSVQAHRFAYELAHGPFDPSLHVLHRCDNPSCVRPDHLFLGTNTDNVADKMAKGRYRCLSGDDHPARKHPDRVSRGEDNGSAKLTWKEVRSIRSMYATKKISQRELAKRFGVSQSVIGSIVRGVTWKE